MWTAGHVINHLREVRSVIVEGQTIKLVEFDDVQIIKELVEKGRRVGEIKMDTQIVPDGLGQMFKNTLESYKNDSLMLPLLESYSNGVNYYISLISDDKYPIEYKILDYKPEAWDLYKTSLLYMYMSWELSGFTNDLANTNFIKKNI